MHPLSLCCQTKQKNQTSISFAFYIFQFCGKVDHLASACPYRTTTTPEGSSLAGVAAAGESADADLESPLSAKIKQKPIWEVAKSATMDKGKEKKKVVTF